MYCFLGEVMGDNEWSRRMKVTKGITFRIAARRRLKVMKWRIPFRIAARMIDKKVNQVGRRDCG